MREELQETTPVEPHKAFIVFLLFLLIVLGLYVRVHGVDYYHYSPDDLMEIDIAAQKTLPELLHTALHETVHPPLGYIVRHYLLMVSDAPWFVRSEALLFGLALIPLYYFVGKALAGPFTGCIAAILCTFSEGLIVQSYVVRNYTLFVLLLTLGFYYFIRWHATRNARPLAAYAVFSTLACLTHFSGMLTVFCLTAAEAVWIYKNNAIGKLKLWLLANAGLAAIAVTAYHFWEPIINGLGTSFMATAGERLAGSFLYPISTLGYILPGVPLTLTLLGLSLLLLFSTAPKPAPAPTRFYIYLACFALALGSLLLVSGIYPFLGTRRSLWLTPFILPVAAAGIYVLFLWLQNRYVFLYARHAAYIAILSFLVLTLAFYDPAVRFADGTEYPLPQSQFVSLQNALKAIAAPVIIAEKDDSVLLQDPYPFIHTSLYPQDDGIPGADQVMLVPSAYGQILLNPIYHRIFSGAMLLAMLENARDHGMLAHADNVVFLHTPWSVFPIEELTQCKALMKKIVVFPAAASVSTRADLKHVHMLVIVSRQALFNAILAPGGIARNCLVGNAAGAGGGT